MRKINCVDLSNKMKKALKGLRGSSHVTSQELADRLEQNLQTINNWKLRGFLPKPTEGPNFRGNKNYYNVDKLRNLQF